MLDKRRRRRTEFIFTAGLIALAAKMAKADGVVLGAEVAAFEAICDIPAEERENVARLFDLAKQSVAGFEGYADQLGRYFSHAPDVLEDVLDGLFHIAKADRALHGAELTYLRAVAERFGLAERFPSILARHVEPADDSPHAILGTHPGMDAGAIRRRYRVLVAQNHPDRLVAEGVPASFLRIANDRLAAINVAYRTLQSETEGR